ncbi:MAG: hypothetical protein EP343_29155 [Deltaproteobacteria bacterium]|nr:MAG: hypothetical protein EP343_29155 [Deltaproteobacteria bacterium]
MRIFFFGLSMFLMFNMVACSNADTKGIAAECTANTDCKEEGQTCLTQFKGGYCGAADCKSDSDCPSLSSCVTHSDGKNYCFRNCTDKAECNANRTAANEANCSANATLVSGSKNTKVCVPPAGN